MWNISKWAPSRVRITKLRNRVEILPCLRNPIIALLQDRLAELGREAGRSPLEEEGLHGKRRKVGHSGFQTYLRFQMDRL